MLGQKVLEERNSKHSGRIRVLKTLGIGTYIQASNLTQSGGVVRDVWNTTLRLISKRKKQVKKCLILGLGGGSAALLVRKYWNEAKITGVDIDPVMVELGKKYLGLGDLDVSVEIGDAFDRVLKKSKTNPVEKYDLVLVDLYLGDKYPEKFSRDEFLGACLGLLEKGGIAVFNRLYYGEKRPEAVKFIPKLERIFGKVECVYPEANIMFVCSDTI